MKQGRWKVIDTGGQSSAGGLGGTVSPQRVDTGQGHGGGPGAEASGSSANLVILAP